MKADTRWPDWKRRFERYRIATKLFKEDEDIKTSTLLYTMGSKSEYVFTQFALDEKEAGDYTFVVGKFEAYIRSLWQNIVISAQRKTIVLATD